VDNRSETEQAPAVASLGAKDIQPDFHGCGDCRLRWGFWRWSRRPAVCWCSGPILAPVPSVEVAGASLHASNSAHGDAAGPPIVMLAWRQSNLEAMRRPLGEALAKHHRVILDRPSRPWLEHPRAVGLFDAGIRRG